MVNLSWALRSLKMRRSFKVPNKEVLQWFPGHMGKGLKQMQQKLKSVDLIIEVHDARIPFSGRNTKFKTTVSGVRPHILVLNKMDLADLTEKRGIEARLSAEGISKVIFTECKALGCKGLREIVPSTKELILQGDRFNRSESTDFCVMIIGVPNVGKSSLINALRNIYLKKASVAPVGAIAGITRSVMSRIKVCSDPSIYIMDTPGILEPSVKDVEGGLKLALCSSMQDHLVGPKLISDYLLYFLNCQKNYSYVSYLGLKEPSDDILEVLLLTAINQNKTIKVKDATNSYTIRPDIEFAANYFIRGFRSGKLGKVMLDDVNERY